MPQTSNLVIEYLRVPYLNPLISTLKPQSNGVLYSNTLTGTLAVGGWAVTFGIAKRGLGGLGPRPVPFLLKIPRE